ncbi:DUF5701 family protein [Streptomyces sp. NPDC127069]|uniref:DUF5701 family protein n=1 Tax=Streptomyces sp. NPDC127069 TaxID=3347128 RepID=UPI00365E23BE
MPGEGSRSVLFRPARARGWCWWNNRHTWLGFGSATGRRAQPIVQGVGWSSP